MACYTYDERYSHRGRDVSIDIAKGIGILLVVVGHGLEISFNDRPDGMFDVGQFELWRFIYSFHMPLFFFLSGVVTTRITLLNHKVILSRCIYLLSIAFIVHLLLSPISPLYHFFTGRPDPLHEVMKKIVCPFLFGQSLNSIVVWYLISLSGVQICTYLIFRNVCLRILIGVISLSLFVLHGVYTENYWQIDSIAPGLLFFFLGIYGGRFKRELGLISAVICGSICVFTAPLNDGCSFSLYGNCPPVGSNQRFAVMLVSGSIGNIPIFLLTAASGIVFILSISNFISKYLPSYPVAWLGRNSLELMIINGVALQYMNPILKKVHIYSEYYSLLLLTALVLLQVLCLWRTLGIFQVIEGKIHRSAAWLAEALSAYGSKCRAALTWP